MKIIKYYILFFFLLVSVYLMAYSILCLTSRPYNDLMDGVSGTMGDRHYPNGEIDHVVVHDFTRHTKFGEMGCAITNSSMNGTKYRYGGVRLLIIFYPVLIIHEKITR